MKTRNRKTHTSKITISKDRKMGEESKQICEQRQIKPKCVKIEENHNEEQVDLTLK